MRCFRALAICMMMAAAPLLAQNADAPAPALLLLLPAAVSNWDSATAGTAGAAWTPGTNPCSSTGGTGGGSGTGGGTGGGTGVWKGVSCTDGEVTGLQLAGLGLAGTLPAQLANLSSLASLNLSSNAFGGGLPAAWLTPDAFPALEAADLQDNQLTGTLPDRLVLLAAATVRVGGNRLSGPLPPSWSSASLATLDISGNALTGLLPPGWGDKTALPALAALHLQGNELRGPLPDPQWTSVGFAAPCTLELQPDNDQLCGPLLEVDPQLYDPAYLLDPLKNYTGDKPQSGSLSNVTTLIVTQSDLFTPGTSVTLTNTLGTCMLPCAVTGGQPASAAIETNLYDVSWQYNVSVSDLLLLNAGASSAGPGFNLSLPCYPPGPMAFTPASFGGDVAWLQFAGGNQLAGLEGLGGAMAASGTNDHLPNQNDYDNPYTGSLAPVDPDTIAANAAAGGDLALLLLLVQPVYLFVDLHADFQISAVILTSANATTNASIYIGANSSAVLGNTLVASGINLAPRQQLAVPAGGAVGRYIVVYTGYTAEGNMSISDFQVYATETNAAAHKPVSVSAQGTWPLSVLVDNDADTCVTLQANSSGGGSTAWAAVDLGYVGAVGSVAIAAGLSLPPATPARVYLKDSLGQGLEEAAACGGGEALLQPGGWAAVACNATGRWVVVTLPSAAAIELCELQVGLTMRPNSTSSSGGGSSSSLTTGTIVGIATGVAAAAGALLLAAMLCLQRRRRLEEGRKREAAAAAAGKGDIQQQQQQQYEWQADQMGGMESGSRHPSPAGSMGGLAAVYGGGSAIGGGFPPANGSEGNLANRSLASSGGSGGGGLHRATSASSSIFLPDAIGGGGSGSGGTRVSYEGTGAAAVAAAAAAAAAAAGIAAAVATDLSKLPQRFNDVSASDFQLVKAIGEGSFGQVWLAKYCETTVAVKMLTHTAATSATSSMQRQQALRNLHREAGLMSRLRHPNVCQYLGACLEPPCLMMEYCAKKSVDSLLAAGLTDTKVAKQLSWLRLISMALDAAKGMLYLHSRSPPIAHRDLKSANLLVDSQWHVKVADFNLSRAVESSMAASTMFITNPRWLAPEVLSGEPGQLAADVWAFGSVLWELMTWRLPFDRMNPFQIIAHVQGHAGSGLEVPPPADLPAGPFLSYKPYCSLMQACWAREAVQRPRFEDILQQLRSMLTAEIKQQQQRQQQIQRRRLQQGSRPGGAASLETTGSDSAWAAYQVALAEEAGHADVAAGEAMTAGLPTLAQSSSLPTPLPAAAVGAAEAAAAAAAAAAGGQLGGSSDMAPCRSQSLQ